MKKILFFWKRLTATFWFVPVLLVIIAIILALIVLSIDSQITIEQKGWSRFLFIGSSDSARSILSIISGAMIGVAGTVFSVTLVALTLASSQFGSRLIRNFMYVRINQIVLGTYIATYIYCLIVLNTIKDIESYTLIPSLSVFVALVGAVLNIILLILFIHNIAVSLQADHVISDITNTIFKDIKTLFPDEIGVSEERNTPNVTSLIANKTCTHITATKNGYLQYIDSDSLLDLIKTHNGLLVLHFRPGHHVVEGAILGSLYSNNIIDDSIIQKIQSKFVIGAMRSSQQDIEFSIHQMVEIAVRALSPGINDPYTAIACIDNLTATLVKLTQVHFPSVFRNDDEGHLRVIAKHVSFEGLVDASFNQIRQNAAGTPAILIRLMDSLITINSFATTSIHKNAIKKHAAMVAHLGKNSINEQQDLNDLLERSTELL